MFFFCTGLAPGSDRLAPKARLGARAQPRRGACRARAAKSARRGAVHKPGQDITIFIGYLNEPTLILELK